MEDSALLDVVKQILEQERDDVSTADSLTDLGWDSLSNILFIAEIDERFGVTVEAEVLSQASTVADLFALVRSAADQS